MAENLVLTLALAGWWLLGPVPAGMDRDAGGPIVTPPALTMTAPPQLAVVPGTSVYHAPGLDITLFAFSGRYYRFHDGAWFHTASLVGSWTAIAPNRVPRPIMAVPESYYKTPRAADAGRPDNAPVRRASALVTAHSTGRTVQ